MRLVAPKVAPVLYIDAEMGWTDWKNRRQTFDAAGLPLDAVTLVSQKTNPEALPTWDITDPRFNQTVASLVERGGYKLVVLDTVSALAPDADENDRRSITPFDQLAVILANLGCSTLLIHHTNKSGDQSGHSARLRQLDYVLEVRKAGKKSQKWSAKLKMTKDRGLLGFPDSYIRLVDDPADGLRFELGKSYKRAPGTPGSKVDLATEARLQKAIREKAADPDNPELSIGKLAEKHGVSKSTLNRYWKKYLDGPDHST